MKTLLIALALAAQAAPTPAVPQDASRPSARAQWTPLASDAWGSYAIDPASVTRDGDSVRFNMRAVAASTLPNGTAYFIAGHAFDCERGTFTILSAYSYRADGSFIGSRETRPDEIARETHPIVTGSAQEQMLARVCAMGR